MKFHVLTLFPEMFEMLSLSILGRAQEDQKITIETINIRDYSTNKHKKVDGYPYGGGAGMVMSVQPIEEALKVIEKKSRVIYLTPKGRVFNQQMACDLAKEEDLVLLCGHYEGVDQRVIDRLVTDEISVGDYVLTGGELPAMILIDAISRLKEGVITDVSYEEESHYNGLLEYPHYTRPADYEGLLVPDVLLSGHHQNIKEYRLIESLRLTDQRRPDMFKEYLKQSHSKEELKIIKKYMDRKAKK